MCENCGVVVDSSTNQALITIGLTNPAAGLDGGYQFLDLGGAAPTFEPPIPAIANTSEDVSIDPVRHLVLSPNESGDYQIVDTSACTDKAMLFNNFLTLPGGILPDSAAEDCTTGIALSTLEDDSRVDRPEFLYIADLTQAKFTPGTPGTWTDAASQIQTFPEFLALMFGTNGIAVAPGTHLGIVTGEFGGNVEGVIQLPPTSGIGTPAVVDWVAFTVPNDPSGATWSEGNDPHTVTAYVSPHSHKALGVLENNFTTETPIFLAVVDLEGPIRSR
jgi:hypothetical protein